LHLAKVELDFQTLRWLKSCLFDLNKTEWIATIKQRRLPDSRATTQCAYCNWMWCTGIAKLLWLAKLT